MGNLSCTCYLAAWSSAARPAIHFGKHRMLRQGPGFHESQGRQYTEARASPLPSPSNLSETTQWEQQPGVRQSKAHIQIAAAVDFETKRPQYIKMTTKTHL